MEHIKDFNELISAAANYLESKLSFKSRTVGDYTRYWKRLRDFMIKNRIRYYHQHVEKKFLLYEFNGKEAIELRYNDRRFYNAIKMLTEFQEKGFTKIPPRPQKSEAVFTGSIGDIITSFLNYKQKEERLSSETIQRHRNCFSRFISYCEKNNVCTIKEINIAVLLHFIAEQDCCNKRRMKESLSTLRSFAKYAFEQKYLPFDHSANLPKCKSVNQPKLPSTYSEVEIEKLLSTVERSSGLGKRNYAMILIAARLGLRASDISNLKFENLYWNKCTIELKQCKTEKELVVPLLPDVGNAIIDYLKYGRPQSESVNVFLKESPPHHLSDGQLITAVVQNAFRKSGIDITGRRFGSHSLRHSLVSRMLEKSVILPVISEVLGHESTESTKYYLRIDFTSMKQCMLDVPLIPNEFYEQKGGAFYD